MCCLLAIGFCPLAGNIEQGAAINHSLRSERPANVRLPVPFPRPCARMIIVGILASTRAGLALRRRRLNKEAAERHWHPGSHQLRSGKMLSQPATSTSARVAAGVAAIVLCCFSAVTPVDSYHLYSHQQNINNLVGVVCEPPFGFLPLTCGDYEVLESRSDPAPIYIYG